jgi:MoaA/NifB/PqqE/SkfB family radical SAM enzyme
MQTLYNAKITASSVTRSTAFLPKKLVPEFASIKLTEKCQMKCKVCDYWKSDPPDTIGTDRAVEMIHELHENGVCLLYYTGGEPLLRQDFFSVLRATRHLEFKRIALQTNGLLLKKYAEEINDSQITNVCVSLDGTHEANDELRGVKGSYAAIVSYLPLIRKPVSVCCTFTSVFAECCDELIDLCKRNGHELIINLPTNTLYHCNSDEVTKVIKDLWPSHDQIEATIGKLERSGIMSKSLLGCVNRYLSDRKLPYKNCILGFHAVNIDSQGNIRTGCYVFKPVGNILRNSLAEIVASGEYRESVDKMYRMDCPHCGSGYEKNHFYQNPQFLFSKLIQKLK